MNLISPLNYQIFPVNNAQAVLFEKFTYPIYRPLLKMLGKDSSLSAVAIMLEQQPIGLALVKIDNNQSEILSFFIHPEHRGKGLGKKLLTQVEIELRKRKCYQVRVIYVSNATTPAFERILEQLNWTVPQLRMLVCKGVIEKFQDSPLLSLTLPSSYLIFPWIELTQKERKKIQQQQLSSPWYPEVLSPFDEEEMIEPINSLGLRYQDQVVGWMITHRVAQDTIRYTKLFVKQELQSLGRAIPLLTTALKLQLEKSDARKGVFTVIADNSKMIKFVDKRLNSYLTSMSSSWQVFKSILL